MKLDFYKKGNQVLMEEFNYELKSWNLQNNYFYLDISIPSFSSNIMKMIDVLYNRHTKSNENTFGFIKDKLTIVISSDFGDFSNDSDEFLSQLKKI